MLLRISKLLVCAFAAFHNSYFFTFIIFCLPLLTFAYPCLPVADPLLTCCLPLLALCLPFAYLCLPLLSFAYPLLSFAYPLLTLFENGFSDLFNPLFSRYFSSFSDVRTLVFCHPKNPKHSKKIWNQQQNGKICGFGRNLTRQNSSSV